MPPLRSLVFSLFLPVFFMGCAQIETKSSQERIYWPKPPDPPRFVFEATLRSEDSIKLLTAEDRFKAAVTGESSTVKRIFSKPFGVAATSGMVVVTDSMRKLGFIFNLPRKKVYRFGNLGTQGVLAKPLGVAIDKDHQIYVSDVNARKVFVYDAFGLFLREIGSQETLRRPVDVAISNDGKFVYVVDAAGIDSDKHQVVVFDQKGAQQFVFGKRGSANGEFNLPTQVDVAPDGTVHVLDAGNFRVQVFTPEGRFLRAWGENGRSFGNLARPRGMAIDANGNVYISDAMYRNFQVFNPQGQLLLAIGGEGMNDRPGQFALPAGIAIDELGFVYIVDQLFGKIDVIRKLSEQEMEQIMAAQTGK